VSDGNDDPNVFRNNARNRKSPSRKKARPIEMSNCLYYGDNLTILREHITDNSVDLIYLDPPFNSQASYNVLFHAPTGDRDKAPPEAFEDIWHWNETVEIAFDAVMASGSKNAAAMLCAIRSFLKDNDMVAYLTMMTVRLLELKRVLTTTGSIYLHCDPTASHYLKILLDGVFGPENFRNEISWRRSNPKSHGSINFANCRDIILRYTKADSFIFNKRYGKHDQSYIDKAYRYIDEDGRRYRLLPLLNPNDNRPNLTYQFLGVTRVWRWTRERMQRAYEKGLVVQLKPGAVPQYKKYLDESEGRTITNDWDDIKPIGTGEDLGYPTQKPLALLQRIIETSSNPGEVVLDPFCGCGTTIHAAQKLKREWIGIDNAYLAIRLIDKRLNDAFPGISYEVRGTPKDPAGARALADQDQRQFQWWAGSLINAVPYGGKRNGSESRIDGVIYFRPDGRTTEKAIVSIKGDAHVDVSMVEALIAAVHRENARIGVFVTLAPPTRPMQSEAAAAGFYKPPYHNKVPKIQILTITELLEGKRPQIPFVETKAFRRARREKAASQGQLF
jgi:site-specific DNA-methyltransferase (adenine-specific)